MREKDKIILDELMKINLNNNNDIKMQYYLYNKEKIKKSTNTRHGFNKGVFVYPPNMTITDVGQDEYAIRENDEILVTYGIITCCGIIVKNDKGLALMHIDALVQPEEVIELLDNLGFGYNSEVILVPGALCNDFDYHSLALDLENRGNNCSCFRLTGEFGSIAIEQENIKICSELDNENIELKRNTHKL